MDYDIVYRQEASDAVIRHLQLDYEYAWGVREAINALPSAERWIPITERLPEKECKCLVTDEEGKVEIGWFCIDHDGEPWFSVEYTSSPTVAWMPLPEPYKDGE